MRNPSAFPPHHVNVDHVEIQPAELPAQESPPVRAGWMPMTLGGTIMGLALFPAAALWRLNAIRATDFRHDTANQFDAMAITLWGSFGFLLILGAVFLALGLSQYFDEREELRA